MTKQASHTDWMTDLDYSEYPRCPRCRQTSDRWLYGVDPNDNSVKECANCTLQWCDNFKITGYSLVDY